MNTLLDYPSLSDRRLVELHLDGDRDAFRQIVERYQAMVCALGLSACGDVAWSEDLAQEVFIVVWKQLPELREPDKLRAWIAGIARNFVHNAFRRQQRTPTARAELLSAELPSGGANPRDQAVSAEEAALMWSSLAGIPENYREPMVLYYREQRSAAAVAEALAISEEAVRQRLTRGRAMLTERMAKLVEETLERSAPTPVFAGMVLLALPLGITPAAIMAEAGLAKSAAGASVAKTVATAGTVGGIAAKGGLAVKTVSLVALLPALLNGFTDFIGFRLRHETVASTEERRRVAWAYVVMQASFGAVVLEFFVMPKWLAKDSGSPWFYGLLGLGLVGLLFIFRWAKRRVDRSVPTDQPALFSKVTASKAPVFEFHTMETLLGLPLVHVRLGGGRKAWLLPVVKAWIAISDGRAVGGLFASGQLALAPVSLGVGAVGLLSLGGFVLGGWALGGIAIGWLSQGFAAFGVQAAKGGLAVAQWFASGRITFGLHANDALATAFVHDHWFYQFAGVAMNVGLWAGYLGWISPLILMAWHLWRTRRSA